MIILLIIINKSDKIKLTLLLKQLLVYFIIKISHNNKYRIIFYEILN